MLARWTNVDVRAVGIAVLEQRKPFEDRRGRNAVDSRKHPPVTQDPDIVEWCLNRSEQIAYRDSVLSIDVILEICFTGWEGSGEGKAPPPLWWASLGIYHLSEMRGALPSAAQAR
jgi:hypothetical protein